MNQSSYQSMPRNGRLAKNTNLSAAALVNSLDGFHQDTVYSYIVATVECYEERLYQTGSGPNFQGDLITLCSCKHLMRTYLDSESWKGIWIAGFTSVKEMDSNSLFYLMKVGEAYESHRALWASSTISEEAKEAKAVHLDKFGDVYQPRRESGSPHSPMSYYRPCRDHVHCEPGDWRQDIKYRDRYGRIPALLVGDPEFSFLWSKPIFESPVKLSRGQRKMKLGELLPFS